MNTCKKYDELHTDWKNQIDLLIRKMKGKSHVADVTIETSELSSYDFKVTVLKYNNSGSKGWATVGYLRNDLFRGGVWRLTYKPRISDGEKSEAGRTAKVG
jgi:hypothetical protein